jgi:hypothetical protein
MVSYHVSRLYLCQPVQGRLKDFFCETDFINRLGAKIIEKGIVEKGRLF